MSKHRKRIIEVKYSQLFFFSLNKNFYILRFFVFKNLKVIQFLFFYDILFQIYTVIYGFNIDWAEDKLDVVSPWLWGCEPPVNEDIA